MGCLLLFHKTIAKPIITYGPMNYDAAVETNLDPFELAHRRILRALAVKNRPTHCGMYMIDKNNDNT